MLPIIERGQSLDRMFAQFAGIPLTRFDGSQNTSGDDFAVDL
jgi:hypothetical protein